MIFLGLTDPPYKTLFFLNFFLIKFIVLKRSLVFGIKPVPIDQTGSYAIIILFFDFIVCKPNLSCLFKIFFVIFFLFFLNYSPIQKITLSPDFNALLILRLISLSSSPACRFSECPIIMYLAPIFFNIFELTEPVKAP